MKIHTIIAILSLLVFSLMAQNTFMPPPGESREVVAKGMGAILAGDEVKAQEDAVSAALRNAVEQVVGMFVESDVLVENYQTMEDRIYTRTAGYVQSYEIISKQKQLDSAVEVTVRAVVKLSDLQSDLSAIGVLISRKGKPRTMVLIDEKNISEHYYHVMANMNVTETALMNELMNYGFPFVDPTQAKTVIARDVVSSALQGDASAAASIASRLGAEIILTGTAISKVASGGPSVVRDAGFKSCQANLTLRAIRADDASIIAVASAHDVAAHIDEITGGTMALEKAAKKASQDIKDKILKVWQQDVYSGTQVQLQVLNIVSFTQLNIFKNSLKYYVRGLQGVNQREFGGGTALFDVDIKGNAESLAGELEAKEIEGLKLQVVGLTANRVTVKIVQPEQENPN
jgi:hypothetical protein